VSRARTDGRAAFHWTANCLANPREVGATQAQREKKRLLRLCPSHEPLRLLKAIHLHDKLFFAFYPV
jgi:hypothetical protein